MAKNKLNQIEKATKGLFELDETKENIDKIAEILNTSFYTYSKHERKEYIKGDHWKSTKIYKRTDKNIGSLFILW